MEGDLSDQVLRLVRSQLEELFEEHRSSLTEHMSEWSARQEAALDRLESFCNPLSETLEKGKAAQAVPRSMRKPGMTLMKQHSNSDMSFDSAGNGAGVLSGLRPKEKAPLAMCRPASPAGPERGAGLLKVAEKTVTTETAEDNHETMSSASGSRAKPVASASGVRRAVLEGRAKRLRKSRSQDELGSAKDRPAGTAPRRLSLAGTNSVTTTPSGSLPMSVNPGTRRTSHKLRRGSLQLKEKISKIENKFNTDFMSRGSIFEKGMDAEVNDSDEGDEQETKGRTCCCLQKVAKRIADTACFDSLCAGVIIANTALIGVEAEFSTLYAEPNETIFHTQVMMSAWYTMELVIRIVASGLRDFFSGPEWKWNWFDSVLVLMAVVDYTAESLLSIAGYASVARVVRILRVIRILRSLRIIRVLRYVREFRKMIFAIQGSIQTLIWSLLLLFFSLYAFAICFTTGVADHIRLYNDTMTDGEVDMMKELYGTLMRSFYSLYLAMSQGRAWGDLLSPLMEVGHIFVALFLIFITVTTFGVLNIVNSVFVESAMRTAQHYRELLVQDKMRDWENVVGHMRQVFQQIDEDGSGSISMQEMERFLADPELGMYVEALDISTADTRALFRLLDRDNSGRIDIEEFCDGCMRLKGPAKSFDIHCVLFEVHRVSAKWAEFMMFAETHLLTIEAILQYMQHGGEGEMVPIGSIQASVASYMDTRNLSSMASYAPVQYGSENSETGAQSLDEAVAQFVKEDKGRAKRPAGVNT